VALLLPGAACASPQHQEGRQLRLLCWQLPRTRAAGCAAGAGGHGGLRHSRVLLQLALGLQQIHPGARDLDLQQQRRRQQRWQG
jgi:hypothetical protein